MPRKSKRDKNSDVPLPPGPTPTPPTLIPPSPLSPSSSQFASLKKEMLKELHNGDQYMRGLFYMKHGDTSRGQYLIGKTIDTVAPGDVKNMNLVGLSLYFEGKVEEALQWFQKALESNPDYPETINNIGLCCYSQGQFAEAIAQYQLAISKKANNAIFWWNLALAQMKSHQIDATLTSLQKVFELNHKLRENATQEATFASLRDHPTFQGLVRTNKAMEEPRNNFF